MKTWTILLIWAFQTIGMAQRSFGQQLIIGGERVERIFRNKTDSAHNFYLALVPSKTPVGLILFLPGFGSYPKSLIEETDLPSKARKDGYVVIIPYFADETFYLDSAVQHNLETLIPEVIAKYKIPTNKFIIGGHSAGGNAALLYAENAIQFSNSQFVKPMAVFGIDPPLDMKRFRNSVVHEIEIDFRKKNVNGMKEFLLNFEKWFGGSPGNRLDSYEKYSAYFRDAKDGGNAKYLRSTPVRLYCDPDVNWAIENQRVGYEHLNASDQSACIAELRLLGNDRAELVVNLGKGVFPGGYRHPHAPSQLDSKDFLLWADKVLKTGE